MTGSDEPEDEGFLRGWSRRKLAARKAATQPPLPPETVASPEQDAEPAPSDDVDADYIAALPSIDSIVEGTDIKPFLARGVPADLRNAALRKLWSATPGVRDHVDPAVDYAWDWNAPGGVPGGGGTLSQNRVAQMVRDLIGGQESTEDKPVQTASASDEPEASNHTKTAVPPDDKPSADRASSSQAKRLTDVSPDPNAAAASRNAREQGASTSSSRPDVPPKRHGGAVPT